MKIGLILSFKGSNYGMMLQALATQYYLEKQGLETEIITYKAGNTFKELFDKLLIHLAPVVTKTSLRSRKRRQFIAKNEEQKNANALRLEKGNAFVEQYLHNIVTFTGMDELTEQTRIRYSSVLIGSDQQWTPQCFYSKINTLSFVADDINKVSYATSMGVSDIPWYTKPVLRKFISKINYVSVREQSGKDILSRYTGRTDVEVMPDPTLLLSTTEWENIIPRAEKANSDYIFCYFLGNNDNAMKQTASLALRIGVKVIAVRNIEIIDNDHYDYYGAEILEAPSIEEFVNYIRNARFVCTDSFHCTVFSIINHVPFATFYRMKSKDKNSRNSRIDNLLNGLGLGDRICELKNIEVVFNEPIDFDMVDVMLEKSRNRGEEYLRRALRGTEGKTIAKLPREFCCGCSLCSYVCPSNAIRMQEDDENFIYPLIEEKQCINCGLCTRKCPVINIDSIGRERIVFSNAKYAYSTDAEIVKHSSSGGVAYGLYQAFGNKGASVVGVKYTDDFKEAIFTLIDYPNASSEFKAFRGSKYIKARENGIFKTVLEKLESGKKVLVIGLPCEIAALKIYVQRYLNNLYTCELICHGPTSWEVQRQYIDGLARNHDGMIQSFTVRGKKESWKPYYIIVDFSNGETVYEKFAESIYNVAFQIMKRPSCNRCIFKDKRSNADLIIGDFHAAKRGTEEYNKMGVSSCFPITKKGYEMLEILKQEGFIVNNADEIRSKGNEALLNPISAYSTRKRFITLMHQQGLNRAAKDKLIITDMKLSRMRKKIKRRLRIFEKKAFSIIGKF